MHVSINFIAPLRMFCGDFPVVVAACDAFIVFYELPRSGSTRPFKPHPFVYNVILVDFSFLPEHHIHIFKTPEHGGSSDGAIIFTFISASAVSIANTIYALLSLKKNIASWSAWNSQKHWDFSLALCGVCSMLLQMRVASVKNQRDAFWGKNREMNTRPRI